MFSKDFFNLVLFCKDIKPRYGRTRTRGFFLTVSLFNYLYAIHKSFETFKTFSKTVFLKKTAVLYISAIFVVIYKLTVTSFTCKSNKIST